MRLLMSPLNKAILAAVVALMAIGGIWIARKIDQRGYNRASIEYEAQIAVMKAANETAIASAQADMLLKTEELKSELSDAETKLQEILNDKGEDHPRGCGAPLRSLRMLDQIR